jgi:hypothetical protein
MKTKTIHAFCGSCDETLCGMWSYWNRQYSNKRKLTCNRCRNIIKRLAKRLK